MYKCPEKMKLNKFKRVQIPRPSKLYQRVAGLRVASMPGGEVADFTSRVSDQISADLRQMDYEAYAESLKNNNTPTVTSDDSVKDPNV